MSVKVNPYSHPTPLGAGDARGISGERKHALGPYRMYQQLTNHQITKSPNQFTILNGENLRDEVKLNA